MMKSKGSATVLILVNREFQNILKLLSGFFRDVGFFEAWLWCSMDVFLDGQRLRFVVTVHDFVSQTGKGVRSQNRKRGQEPNWQSGQLTNGVQAID
jgi:hypothetical protein